VNRSLRPEPEASAEFEDAVRWYEGRRAGLGLEFVESVDATLALLARWPDAGHRIRGVPSEIPARRLPLSRFPYHVVYLEWDGAIRILAFAHDSRRPSYWLSRV